MNYSKKIKQYGIINSLKRTIIFIFRRFGMYYEEYIFCSKQLNCIRLASPLTCNYKVVKLLYEDFEGSSIIKLSEIQKKVFRARFNNMGYMAYGIYDKKDLVYFTWISLNKIEIGKYIEVSDLKNDEGLLLDSYCHPKYRGTGLHSYMNTFRLNKLFENGKTRAIAIVIKENIPARRTQANDGFKPEKRIKVIHINGKTKILSQVTKMEL